MHLRRLATVLTLVLLAMLATVAPASAHAELRASTPAQGAALDTVPTQIQLTFSEAVSPKTITVTGAPGADWTVGQISVEGPVVTAPVRPIGPAGPYAIAWTVTSEDGDDVSGVINFSLTVPAAPSTTATTTTTTTTTTTEPAAATTGTPVPSPAAAQPADDGGVPVWVWILVGVVVLLAVGLLLARRRTAKPAAERTSNPDDSEA